MNLFYLRLSNPSFCRLFAVFGSFFLQPFFVLCSKLIAEWVFAISGVGVYGSLWSFRLSSGIKEK